MITRLVPPHQRRMIALTRHGQVWRACIVPPAPPLPAFQDFDKADAALGFGARLAHETGWHLVDQTGRRSPAELFAAIERAAAIAIMAIP